MAENKENTIKENEKVLKYIENFLESLDESNGVYIQALAMPKKHGDVLKINDTFLLKKEQSKYNKRFIQKLKRLFEDERIRLNNMVHPNKEKISRAELMDI